MRLHVKNINLWDEFSIRIDIYQYKHILLCGKSGIGKSSILNSIYYALTGLGMTGKWNVKNKKKGIIQLSIESYNLSIERTINPKGLRVTCNNQTETGDNAQVLIDNIFGLFPDIGYVKQKSTFFYFINMTPKERMTFFETFLFDNLDIEDVKQKLRKKVDDAKLEYIRVESVLQSMEKVESSDLVITLNDLYDITDSIDELQIQLQQYSPSKLHSSRAVYQEVLNVSKETEIEFQLLSKQQTFLKKYLDNEETLYKENLKVVGAYEENFILHASYDKSNAIFNSNISNIRNELDTISPQLLNLEELEEKIVRAQHIMETNHQYISLQRTIEKLNFDESAYIHLQKTVDNLFLYQTKCPSCEIDVDIYGSRIEVATKSNHDTLNISKLKLDLKIQKDKYTKYKLLQEELVNVNSKLGNEIIPTEDDYKQLYELKKKQIELHSRYKELENELKIIVMYKNVTKPPKSRISQESYQIKKDAIGLYESYQSKYKTNETLINKLTTDLNNFTSRITQLEAEINILEKDVEMYNTIQKKVSEQQQILEHKTKIYNYKQVSNQLEIKKGLYTDIMTFQKLFIKSISDVLMYTLNSINFIVQKYINGFFEAEIQFSFYLNENKNCIDTRTVPDLTILSGGEYDRIVLAIVLAFAEFFKLPLLLLDEIINSLDINTTQQVIQHIQLCYPDNQAIIYVGHQTIQGIFDSVVCLDEKDYLEE